MKRSSKNPPVMSKWTTLRDVVGPGVGMGPCPDQHLGGVVGTYIPASSSWGGHVVGRLQRLMSRVIRRTREIGKQDDPAIQSSLELFAGLSVAEISEISRHLSVVDLTEGQILGRQGKRCREFTVVLSGQVGISRDGVPVALMGPGSWFGCLALLGWGSSKERYVTASALGDVRVAVANEREFAHLVEDFPVVGDRIFKMAHLRLKYVREIESVEPLEQHAEYPVHLFELAA